MCHRVSEKGCSRIHQFSHWLVGRSCFPAISIYFWCKETKLNVLLGSQYVAAARARPRQHAASLLHKAVWVFVLLFSLDIPSLLLEGDMSLWQGGSKHRHCCPGKLKLIQLWLAEFLVAWETESNLTKIPVLDKRTLSTELGVKGHWPFIIWNSKPSILFIIIYNTFFITRLGMTTWKTAQILFNADFNSNWNFQSEVWTHAWCLGEQWR